MTTTEPRLEFLCCWCCWAFFFSLIAFSISSRFLNPSQMCIESSLGLSKSFLERVCGARSPAGQNDMEIKIVRNKDKCVLLKRGSIFTVFILLTKRTPYLHHNKSAPAPDQAEVRLPLLKDPGGMIWYLSKFLHTNLCRTDSSPPRWTGCMTSLPQHWWGVERTFVLSLCWTLAALCD